METDDPIGAYAAERFGVAYLYPYQRLVIANVLDSVQTAAADDGPARQIVILPTGAGKSLCFQLPAALCPGPTLVVYPLLGLMADQARRLEGTGAGAVTLRGGMPGDDRRKALESIRSGAARVVITNPETLRAPGVASALAEAGPSHFVIDEAHCVAEWGDSFRPAYLSLGEAIRAIRPRVVTAFTATASPPILARVAEVLFGDEPYGLVSGAPDRPNIRYSVRPALSMRRELRAAAATMPKPMIVFARSRPGVQLLAEDLLGARPGLDCRFYHAGLDKAERAAVEAWFMGSDDGVLCSTCAYGMGMDKANVRSVVHYGPPASVEAYLQESGRAGRDGEPSEALLIRKAEPGERSIGDGRLDRDRPTAGSNGPQLGPSEARAETMRLYASGNYGCRRSFLLAALGYPGAAETACSSCDRCDGTAAESAPGAAELAAIAARHPRRFDAAGLAAFAIGAGDAATAPLRGTLSGWMPDEAGEAVAAALGAGLLRRRGRRPWKGSISPGTRRRPARQPRPRRPPEAGTTSWPS
ncbi:MAG TPA: RecQ family ATP-dependent DNA helicase [Spirochaetales bacterium]|nr:RecQ family ATP-dependent DNA helicase [Spirochaetales bacterium]